MKEETKNLTKKIGLGRLEKTVRKIADKVSKVRKSKNPVNAIENITVLAQVLLHEVENVAKTIQLKLNTEEIVDAETPTPRKKTAKA